MKNNSKLIIGAIFVVVILAVAEPRVGSNPITYMMLVFIIIIGVMTNNADTSNKLANRAFKEIKKNQAGMVELGEKEKKFLIFHILTELDRRETIDMGDLTSELNVSIYELTNIVKFLGKHGTIEVIYPPLQNFPIIRKGDPQKSQKLRLSIYNAMAKKNILGEVMMDEFAKEVSEYLEMMKRDSTKS